MTASMIEKFYSHATLSQAAYASIPVAPSSADVIAALQSDAGGFSATQAVEFAAQHSVVTQYNDADTSFSATVFKDGSGNLTLAIRGTLEGEIGDRPRFYSHD